jgi:hypothetical protein
MGLQAAVEASGIPNSLAELEDIAAALAKHFNLSPSPGILDVYAGVEFDLEKEMLLYCRPNQEHQRQSSTHTDMLPGLLNSTTGKKIIGKEIQ